MVRIFFYLSIFFIFTSCENSSEVDNDPDVIDEKKVKRKYEELKEELKDTGEELDSTGKEIKKEFKNVEDEIDEEV